MMHTFNITTANQPAVMERILRVIRHHIIFCTGIVEILMIPISSAVKGLIVNTDGGAVMMTPDGSDTIEDSVITDGNSITFGPKSSTAQWRTLTSSVGNYS